MVLPWMNADSGLVRDVDQVKKAKGSSNWGAAAEAYEQREDPQKPTWGLCPGLSSPGPATSSEKAFIAYRACLVKLPFPFQGNIPTLFSDI